MTLESLNPNHHVIMASCPMKLPLRIVGHNRWTPGAATTGGMGGMLPHGPGPAPDTGTDGSAPMPRPPEPRKENGGSINWGTPKWMVYNGKSHLKDDLGVPLF